MYKPLLATLCFMLGASAHALEGKSIIYSVNDLQYEGYSMVVDKNAPLILLLHDWDGLTDYEITRATMLADMGYSVFVADLFGKGVRPTEVADKRQHTGELYKDRNKMRALIKGALKTALAQGANTKDAIALGYCFGGAAVLEAARNESAIGKDPFRAYVTFHGGLKTPEGQNYSNTQGKVMVFHGSADTAITMDEFARLTQELEGAGIAHEMLTYGGAPHAFTVFGSERYQQGADKKSWARFSDFLQEELPVN